MIRIPTDLMGVTLVVSLGVIATFFATEFVKSFIAKDKLTNKSKDMQYIPCEDTTYIEEYIIGEALVESLDNFEGCDRITD